MDVCRKYSAIQNMIGLINMHLGRRAVEVSDFMN